MRSATGASSRPSGVLSKPQSMTTRRPSGLRALQAFLKHRLTVGQHQVTQAKENRIDLSRQVKIGGVLVEEADVLAVLLAHPLLRAFEHPS